jgi:tetratricopeptide repeat protein
MLLGTTGSKFGGALKAIHAVAIIVWLILTAVVPAGAQDSATADRQTLEAKKAALFRQMLVEPANLDVTFAYAEIAAQLGDNEAAVSALERMLLFNPDLPRVDLELGALYFRMGSFEMARSYFDKALATNSPPEVKARVDQYVAQITREEAPSRLSGYVLLGGQYQSDANVAPGSATITSPIGPLLLSNQFVKMRDENLFLTGSALYSYDLGTQSRDTLEVIGTGFVQHYFRVQRLSLDLGELAAGPRFRFLDLGVPGIQAASLKPYTIVNEVGLGQKQYFDTFGAGLEGAVALWQDVIAKAVFEIRHKNFTNQPERPSSTGLNGSDKLVSFILTKPVTTNSVLSFEFDFLNQDTRFKYYANRSYSGLVSYSIHYDDPTGIIRLPWQTTFVVSRAYSLYRASDPCCSTSGNSAIFSASSRDDRRWRFGITQTFQIAHNIDVVLQAQRDIVSSNLSLYGYTSNSVLVGPQIRF